MKKIAQMKTKLRPFGGLGIFHDSRADVRSLATVINESIAKQNEIIETVNKLIELQNKKSVD